MSSLNPRTKIPNDYTEAESCTTSNNHVPEPDTEAEGSPDAEAEAEPAPEAEVELRMWLNLV